MAPRISQDLSRISKSATELNAIADDATTQIRALDELLTRSNLGTEFDDSCDFHHGREENTNGHRVDTVYRLGYGRSDDDKGFSIIVTAHANATNKEGVRIWTEGGDVESEVVWSRRLDKVGRALRLEALRRLPEFLSGLASHVEAVAKSAREGLAEVKAVTDELKSALAIAPESSLDRIAEAARKEAARNPGPIGSGLIDFSRNPSAGGPTAAQKKIIGSLAAARQNAGERRRAFGL